MPVIVGASEPLRQGQIVNCQKNPARLRLVPGSLRAALNAAACEMRWFERADLQGESETQSAAPNLDQDATASRCAASLACLPRGHRPHRLPARIYSPFYFVRSKFQFQ